MKSFIYVWDITSEIKDKFIYKVEYIGKKDSISFEARDRAINKARFMSYKLNGNRKCFMLDNDGFEPYSGCKLTVVEVPVNTPQLKKWQGKTAKPIASFDDGEDFEWEDFLMSLEDKMAGHNYFKIGGKDIDWLHHEGVKFINSNTPRDLVSELYNEGCLELYNGKRKDEFMLRVPSHDCPFGSYYYFKPICEKTYEENRY